MHLPRWTGLLIAATVLIPMLGQAEVTSRREIRDDEASRWRAVGSLNVKGFRACTAALISEHEAITAAHCVVDRRTGLRTAPASYQLVLGKMANGSAAKRGVTATAFLPEFLTASPASTLDTIAGDLALLVLDEPVTAEEVQPFEVAEWDDPIGAFVHIVGYERGGPPGATIREDCTAVDTQSGVTTESCDLIAGLSGSPVLLSENPDDPPRLVATVSSRGQGMGYVVSIAPHLARLRSLIGK